MLSTYSISRLRKYIATYRSEVLIPETGTSRQLLRAGLLLSLLYNGEDRSRDQLWPVVQHSNIPTVIKCCTTRLEAKLTQHKYAVAIVSLNRRPVARQPSSAGQKLKDINSGPPNCKVDICCLTTGVLPVLAARAAPALPYVLRPANNV